MVRGCGENKVALSSFDYLGALVPKGAWLFRLSMVMRHESLYVGAGERRITASWKLRCQRLMNRIVFRFVITRIRIHHDKMWP
jgi:hypothetical protein